ncbi:hypothetical protein ACIQU6_44380 [Streptomyces sp. NPDC090442]|uniref:hypothetical protein n=1 Tax=Streptomyces sp. NPDC090442 TaxID=3365962 RepID=UPI003827489D
MPFQEQTTAAVHSFNPGSISEKPKMHDMYYDRANERRGRYTRGRPFKQRDVAIYWDRDPENPQAGRNAFAKEVRPGVAVVGDPSFYKRRVLNKGRFWSTHMATLTPGAFCDEVDNLIGRIENTAMGRDLINFFASCSPIPYDPADNGSEYGDSLEPYGINPRVLTAREVFLGVPNPLRPIKINVVILQDLLARPSAMALSRSQLNGYGCFSTVAFHPRLIVMTDNVAMSPESVLAHELIHSVHHISGSLNSMTRSASAVKWRSDYKGMAADFFRNRNLIDYRLIEPWLHHELPIDPDERNLVLALLDEYKDLERMAIRILREPLVAGSSRSITYQRHAKYEETVTHGSEVCTAWLNGILKKFTPRRLGVSPGEDISDRIAELNILRVRHDHPEGETGALQNAELIRNQRLIARYFTEVEFCKQAGEQSRISYIPVASRIGEGGSMGYALDRIQSPKARSDIPESVFKLHGSGVDGEGSVYRLLEWARSLGKPEPGNDYLLRISEHIIRLESTDWPILRRIATSAKESIQLLPYSCNGDEEVPIPVTIPESQVSELTRTMAQETALEVSLNPGIEVTRLGSRRLYQGEGHPPLPPH